jgi:hypothetical protein
MHARACCRAKCSPVTNTCTEQPFLSRYRADNPYNTFMMGNHFPQPPVTGTVTPTPLNQSFPNSPILSPSKPHLVLPPPLNQFSPALPSFPPPKPYLVLRDILCSCEAYGMRPMHKTKKSLRASTNINAGTSASPGSNTRLGGSAPTHLSEHCQGVGHHVFGGDLSQQVLASKARGHGGLAGPGRTTNHHPHRGDGQGGVRQLDANVSLCEIGTQHAEGK